MLFLTFSIISSRHCNLPHLSVNDITNQRKMCWIIRRKTCDIRLPIDPICETSHHTHIGRRLLLINITVAAFYAVSSSLSDRITVHAGEQQGAAEENNIYSLLLFNHCCTFSVVAHCLVGGYSSDIILFAVIFLQRELRTYL